MDTLKDSLDELGESVGNKILPHLQKFADKLNELVTKFANLDPKTQDLIMKIIGITAVAGPLLIVLGALARAIGALMTPAGIIILKFGLIIAVVALVIAGLIWLEQRTGWLSTAFNWLTIKAKELWHWFQLKILPAIIYLGNIIKDQFMGAWNDLKKGIEQVKTALAPYQKQIMFIAKFMGGVLLAVILIVIGAVALIIGSFIALTLATAKVIGWISRLYGWIGQLVRFSISMLRLFILQWQILFQRIAFYARNIGNIFSTMKQQIINTFKNAGNWLWDSGKNIIDGLINGIKSKIDTVKNTLGDLTNLLPSWKGPATKDKIILQQSGEMVMGGFIKGLESMYGKAQASLGGFTGNLGATNNSNTSIYGNINISNRQDANYLLNKLDRNNQLTGMGMSIQ
jgi:hypothetical protein